MKVACFDVSGTLVHHVTREPIPLMPMLLHSAWQHGWYLKATTTWGKSAAKEFLTSVCGTGQIPACAIEIVSSYDKTEYITRLLSEDPETRVFFVDDKPEHIEAARQIRDERLRVIGFLGTRKYAPVAGERCSALGIEYALTAIDLAERLQIPLPVGVMELHELRLPAEQVIDLIPGLHHPGSSLAGETGIADHRMVFAELSKRREEWVGCKTLVNRFWRNLAGVKCDECMWKLMVHLALLQAGVDSKDVLGKANKAHEYTSALQSAPTDVRHQLHGCLRKGLDQMAAGMEEIGGKVAGQECDDYPDARSRIERNRLRVSEAFAKSPQ